MPTIEQGFQKAFEKVEQQIREKGAANTDDVKTLQTWQALLGLKHEANRPNEAIEVTLKFTEEEADKVFEALERFNESVEELKKLVDLAYRLNDKLETQDRH